MKEVGTQPETKTDPLRELALAAQGGDSSTVAALWESVEGFIRWQARRRFHTVGNVGGAEVDDLVQQGFFGLVEAINDFNPERGNFLALLSFHLLKVFAEAEGFRGGKDPLNGAASLDEPLGEIYGDDSEQTRADLIPDQRAEAAFTGAEQKLFIQDLHRTLTKALDALSPAQREIIKARYFEGRTLKRVGEERGITASRARQIEGDALRKLRQQAGKYGLEQFVEQRTIFYKSYGIKTMQITETSPVEAIFFDRERLRALVQTTETRQEFTVI